jgi:dTDP-4-dehydrorhamnose 3,5-epimerase
VTPLSERFRIGSTPLAGLVTATRSRVGDERGYLSRLYCADALAGAGFVRPIVQINQTLTRRRGTVRGMHFQCPPYAEDKFVSVLAGEIWDVAVDLRAGSPTFLQWHGERLTAENGRSLFIPVGFAHGFQALTDDCELSYLHTAAYTAEAEGGLDPFDPRLSIAWPLPVTEISARDRAHPPLDRHFKGPFA